MRLHRQIVFVFAVVAARLPAQLALQPALTSIPVKSVMLFSSGVGFFEHAGMVRGNGSTELRFNAAQINDVLKSLLLLDQDGGNVSAITYSSQDPITKTLRSFQVDITGNPSLASLLNQLRGARVTVQYQAERMTGTVLGVENRTKAGEKGETIQTPTLNLLTGPMIRSIELPSITSLTLDDGQLQDELTRALLALSQARDQDKKPVTIDFKGSGDRRVRIGYLVETPIWKTSYRLMLDGKSARIQGWAIVENQTESDWNDVSLSLVSGRPSSFIMDLYRPLYVQRPEVVPDLYAGLEPQLYDAATRTDRARAPMQLSDITVTSAAKDPLVPRNGVASRMIANTTGFEEASITTSASSTAFGNAQAGIMNITTASRMGELFQYAISNVTLARQKSAMLPIITDSVGIERLSIYNWSVEQRHPLNGIRLRNTTGKFFLQGPVTVLDKDSYAGDARIDNVPPGQDRLLSYGVDLELVVDNTKNSQVITVSTGRIGKGILTIERRLVSSVEYQVDNKSTRDKTILIEHPIRAGWKLTGTSKPVESTRSVHRFQGTATAGKVTVLSVQEENVRQEGIMMLSAAIPQLLTYSRMGEIPQAVRDAITKAIQLKQGIIDLERQIAERSTQINAIAVEQERIRENMKTVEQKSQYYERLLTKLNAQESTIERLQKDRDDLNAARDGQQKALDEYLSGLNIG